jgi:hypothetical protein
VLYQKKWESACLQSYREHGEQVFTWLVYYRELSELEKRIFNAVLKKQVEENLKDKWCSLEETRETDLDRGIIELDGRIASINEVVQDSHLFWLALAGASGCVEAILSLFDNSGNALPKNVIVKEMYTSIYCHIYDIDDIDLALEYFVEAGFLESVELQGAFYYKLSREGLRLRELLCEADSTFTSFLRRLSDPLKNLFVSKTCQEPPAVFQFQIQSSTLFGVLKVMHEFSIKWQRSHGAVNSANLNEFLSDFLMEYREIDISSAREVAFKLFSLTPSRDGDKK